MDFTGNKLSVGETVGVVYMYDGTVVVKKAKVEGFKGDMVVASRVTAGKLRTVTRMPEQVIKLWREK